MTYSGIVKSVTKKKKQTVEETSVSWSISAVNLKTGDRIQIATEFEPLIKVGNELKVSVDKSQRKIIEEAK